MKHYKELPGIGRYTSQAVQIFATNADLVTVDTNIRRILIDEFHVSEDVSDKALWGLAQACLPKGRSRDWHNALMDFGALYLTSKKSGIAPKSRQSRFEGSDRQIRARILRQLLQAHSSLLELEKILGVEQKRLTQILEKMIHDQLIVKMNNTYRLNE
jgi:A/G-specific adenine glycosylase